MVMFGEEMRRLMTEQGLSLRRLAKLARYDTGYLSKVMNGRKPPSRDLAARLDRALNADGALLDAASQAESDRFSARVIVTRKGSPSSPAEGPAGLFAPSVVGTVGRALYQRGRAQLEAPPDLPSLRARVVAVWELRQSAQYLAMGEWLGELLREASAAPDAARTEQEQLQATAITVHACNAASSLLKRLNAFELAAIAADRAYQAACSAGSELLRASAALRVSNVFLAAGRYAEAIETAAGTADHLMTRTDSRGALTATCGALLLTAALGAARLNESVQAWELLGAAKAASARLGYDHADLHAVFGPANLMIHGVQVATELGDPRKALRRASGIRIERLPESLAERRSTLLVDIARSHSRAADYAAAVSALLGAERIAPEELRFNVLARQLVTDLMHRMRGRMPELRALASSMSVQA